MTALSAKNHEISSLVLEFFHEILNFLISFVALDLCATILLLDLIYIQNYSIVLDFKIMFLTVKSIFTSDSTEGY